MIRKAMVATVVALLAWVGTATAAPTLETGRGRVEKVGRESVTILPRLPDGKFGKSITLRVTGTTSLSSLSSRMQGKKVVPVQREIKLKDLKANQRIAVIYLADQDRGVLLAAVVMPSSR